MFQILWNDTDHSNYCAAIEHKKTVFVTQLEIHFYADLKTNNNNFLIAYTKDDGKYCFGSVCLNVFNSWMDSEVGGQGVLTRFLKYSEYDREIPQLQTADKPIAPRGRATQQSLNT